MQLTWTLEMRMVIREIVMTDLPRWREYANAEMYHAPYVFWGLALRDGLITQEEHERARRLTGDLWNYVGD